MSGSGTGTLAVTGGTSTVAGRTDVPFLLERVSGPATEPVTLAAMKLHLRGFANVTDLDTEVSEIITTAREWVEEYTGRALMDQTWRITINNDSRTCPAPSAGDMGWWPAWTRWLAQREILLMRSPVLAITSFVTVDSAGTETAVAPTVYALTEPDSKWPRIAGLSGSTWNGSTLKIEFRAGYANAALSPAEGSEVVPARLIQAMKLYASALYDRDEKMMDKLIEAAQNLVKPERCGLGIA